MTNARLTIQDIAARLQIGKMAVYKMLESDILPGIRVGNRWLVTRYAYEQWEKTCGTQSPQGAQAKTKAPRSQTIVSGPNLSGGSFR
jgi:excisionase family DNA binding protein